MDRKEHKKESEYDAHHEAEACDIGHRGGYGATGQSKLSKMPHNHAGDDLEAYLGHIDKDHGASKMELLLHFKPILHVSVVVIRAHDSAVEPSRI